MTLERAELLLEQSRPDLAERELRRALVQEPEDGRAHALLSLCLTSLDRDEEALAEADEALRLQAGSALAQRARACALAGVNRLPEAEDAAREALALEPFGAHHAALLAAILLDRGQPAEALGEADHALALDPGDALALNVRSSALIRLNRREEAAATVDGALAQHPLSSPTHASDGWARLHRGDVRGANEAFREALRLDPSNGWAREGLVEAMKARNPVYGLLLRYFLWMSRLDSRTAWMVIIGAFVGARLISSLDRGPLRVVAFPLLGAYFVFVYLTWTAPSMFNLVLLASRDGRYALSRDERTGAWCFAALLGAALLLLAGGLLGSSVLLVGAVAAAVLTMPVGGAFNRRPGRRRTILLALCGVWAACILAGATASLAGAGDDHAGLPVLAGLIGAIATIWVATFLRRR